MLAGRGRASLDLSLSHRVAWARTLLVFHLPQGSNLAPDLGVFLFFRKGTDAFRHSLFGRRSDPRARATSCRSLDAFIDVVAVSGAQRAPRACGGRERRRRGREVASAGRWSAGQAGGRRFLPSSGMPRADPAAERWMDALDGWVRKGVSVCGQRRVVWWWGTTRECECACALREARACKVQSTCVCVHLL